MSRSPARRFGDSAVSDDFNRADGGLGSGWTAVSDGGMSISSQAVAGSAGATTGDIRTAETYGSDQYSQVEVTSTQLTGGQWVGPAVRCNQRAERLRRHLLLEFRQPGADAIREERGRLDAARRGYVTGPLAAGTQLRLTAVGSTISFLANGVQQMSVTDSTLHRRRAGHHGLRHPTADNWSGGERRLGAGTSTRSAGLFRGCPGRWCCRTTAAMTSASAPTARSRSPPRWPPGRPTA